MITRHKSQDGFLIQTGQTVFYEDECGEITHRRFPHMPKRFWNSLYVNDCNLVAAIADREEVPLEDFETRVHNAVEKRVSCKKDEFAHDMSKLMYRILSCSHQGVHVSKIVNNSEIINRIKGLWFDIFGEVCDDDDIAGMLYQGYFSSIDD